MAKMQSIKFRPYEKNEVKGTEDTQNMIPTSYVYN
jgi:hypothetical protein